MLKDIVVGLTVIAVPWTFILAVISSRLVWSNWGKITNWRSQDRETQTRMSLWIAVPLIMGPLAWQNCVAAFNYLEVKDVPMSGMIQILIYRPWLLAGIAFGLWYAFNRIYHPDYDLVNWLWVVTFIVGIIAGIVATVLSYIF